MNTHTIRAAFFLAISAIARASRADAAGPTQADPLFPGAGRFMVSGATGVPFIASAEMAYAPSRGFAVGALFVATPIVLGAGLRPRGALLLSIGTRLVLSAPILYYPATTGSPIAGGEPWFLAQPALRLEKQLGTKARAYLGAGAIAAVGVVDVSTKPAYQRGGVQTSMPWGIWNTFNGGVSLAIGSDTTLFGDIGLVMRGARIAGGEWIGGPPFFVSMGIARTL